MRKNVDYDLLVKVERVRYQSDFSGAHWLHQVIAIYEQGICSKLRREAFESVIRAAINSGYKATVELSKTFPDAARFPTYLKISGEKWKETQEYILNNFEQHENQRFKYVRDGD